PGALGVSRRRIDGRGWLRLGPVDLAMLVEAWRGRADPGRRFREAHQWPELPGWADLRILNLDRTLIRQHLRMVEELVEGEEGVSPDIHVFNEGLHPFGLGALRH